MDDKNMEQSTNTPPGTCQAQESPSLIANMIQMSESFVQFCSESSLFLRIVSLIHKGLQFMGLPEEDRPTPITVFRIVIVITITLLSYYFILGKKHMENRNTLNRELKLAQAKVRSLQAKLEELDREQQVGNFKKQKKEVRIFMDGAFDLLHYGHMNAFRLARSLGTSLIVGVNSDESITKCKGAPLMSNEERLTMVKTCKFVDDVVEDCPYVMSPEYLDWVIKEYNIDYVVHGSDPCYTLDGEDVYASAKAAGKFRTIPRTEGVSTSDILGRILTMNKEHHIYASTGADERHQQNEDGENGALGHKSKFLTTSLLLKLFSDGVKAPGKNSRIVYIDGTWDLFHPGHVAILKAARERGDYLIVGIHGDAVINRLRGMNMPLMNLHERVLSVLGCQYTDDVLIDAPYEITPEMITRLNISEVVCGTKHDDIGIRYVENTYAYPKKIGILTVIESPSTFNLARIFERIRQNQEAYQAKFIRKMKAEAELANDNQR